MKISDAPTGGVNVKSIGIVLVFCGFVVFSPLDFFHTSLERSSHNFGPLRGPRGLKILQWPYIVWKQLNTFFAYAVALLLLSVSRGLRNMVLVQRDGFEAIQQFHFTYLHIALAQILSTPWATSLARAYAEVWAFKIRFGSRVDSNDSTIQQHHDDGRRLGTQRMRRGAPAKRRSFCGCTFQ